MSFASSRNLPKLSETGDKPTPTVEDNEEDISGNARSRFFRDRDSNKTNTSTTQKNVKEERESWHAGRAGAGRGFADDEDRNGDRERHNGRRDRNTDQDEPGTRRNGLNNRSDQRWSREGERGMAKMGETQRGGWREREREKRNERDWERGGAAEKDPEWMDEPAEREDKNAMKTQEDFERWKERMRAGNAQPDVKEDSLPQEAATPVKAAALDSTKPATPSVQDGPGFDKLFGTWGEAKRLDSPAEVRPAKTPAAKNKSRFASMFAPKDEPQFAEPASPSIPLPAANGSNEDKEGFARILQMLGKNTMSPAPGDDVSSPLPRDAGLGLLFGAGPTQERNRPPSYPHSPHPQDTMSAMFEKKPGSTKPNRAQAGFADDDARGPPPQDRPQSFGGPLETAPQGNVISPDAARMRLNDASHTQNRASHDMQSIFLDQPPRNMATPESLNIQQILAAQQRTPKPTSLNKDSEFLLNLIQTKNASRPPSQATRPPHDDQDNFQLFLDQPPKLQTHAPKPQVPRPPGLLEDQLFKSGQPMPPGMEHQQNHQVPRQRVPPGFFEDPSILQQQSQRRYPAEPPQARRLSAAQHGTGMPPGMPGLGPQQGYPADFAFMAGPNDRGMHLPGVGVGPPPGFANMRGPPGFPPNMTGMYNQGQPPSSQQQHAPQIPQQQQQQPQQQQADNRMQGPPPGFPAMSNMPLPPGYGMHVPAGLPPGFFGGPGPGALMRGPQDGGPPPGMMQQMRSPLEQMPLQMAGLQQQQQQQQGQQQHVGGPPPGFARR